MEITTISHGNHVNGGNNWEDYDGPLSSQGKTELENIKPRGDYDLVCRGLMQRQKETAEALGLLAAPCLTFGSDEEMFQALEGKNTQVLKNLEFTLNTLKGEGIKSMLIITSRFYPIAIQYLLRGGEKELGPFHFFLKTIEDMSKWKDGTKVPVMDQAKILTFKW